MNILVPQFDLAGLMEWRAYGMEQIPQGSLNVFTSTIPHGEDEYIVFSYTNGSELNWNRINQLLLEYLLKNG